jgi:hypothetical protein
LIRQAGARPLSKRCFENCARIALAADQTRYADEIRYVEGQLYTAGIPIHHAWLMCHDRLVDVTLVDRPGLAEQDYRPEHELMPDQIWEEIERVGRYGPFYDVAGITNEQLAALYRSCRL